MNFEFKYTEELSTGIILNDDGTITFYDAKSVDGMFAYSTPSKNYEEFIVTLNCISKLYPQIFYIVYKHIQNRDEIEYQNLKKYCKSKDDIYTRKLKY